MSGEKTPMPTGQHNVPSSAPKHPDDEPIPEYSNPSEPLYTPPATDTVEDDYRDDGDPEGKHSASKNFTRKLEKLTRRATGPINSLAARLGAESFLPASLDKECEKAARILRAFCKDGIYTDTDVQQPTPTGGAAAGQKPRPQQKVLLTIPSKVISRAVGLAIFTTARAGFHVSGSTGSGVLVARMANGEWSPPSAIGVHALGAGFVFGVDIYDCVCVINTREALEAFTRNNARVSLGTEIAVTAGPYGAGGAVDFAAPAGGSQAGGREQEASSSAAAVEQYPQPQQPATATGTTAAAATPLNENRPSGSSSFLREARESVKKPVYSYVKSRGLYAGVSVDGTVFVERKDANAAFYGERIPAQRILRGEVPSRPPPANTADPAAASTAASAMWPAGARPLLDVLRGAEGWRGAPGSASFDYYGGSAKAATAAQEYQHQQVHAEQDDAPPAYIDSGAPHVADEKTGSH